MQSDIAIQHALPLMSKLSFVIGGNQTLQNTEVQMLVLAMNKPTVHRTYKARACVYTNYLSYLSRLSTKLHVCNNWNVALCC